MEAIGEGGGMDMTYIMDQKSRSGTVLFKNGKSTACAHLRVHLKRTWRLLHRYEKSGLFGHYNIRDGFIKRG